MAVLREDIISRLKIAASGRDQEMDVAGVALLLAQTDFPSEPLAPFHEHLAHLTVDLSGAVRNVDHVQDMTAALSDVLFRIHDYAGDTETYDDMKNANLMRVIDRRKGLPVALGILLIHMARAQGWAITGLNFPGHFLLRLTHAGEQAIIDPFRNAKRLTADNLAGLVIQVQGSGAKMQATYLKSVSDRGILLRLQNNIKTRALAEEDTDHALEVLETMTLIAPDSAAVVSELAILEAETGNFRQALDRLTSFLTQRQGHPEEAQIVALTKNLQRHLN